MPKETISMKQSLSYVLFFFIACVALPNAIAQTQEEDEKKPVVAFSGALEAYYSYDFDNPDDHNRPFFLFSYNRHNEVNINLAFLKATYTAPRVRGNLALMAGTYANANLSAEPGVLKNIYEANAGFKISKEKDLWLDAGIFASHIGFESAYGPSCWTVTRSILAENSPYYESGAKLTYTNGDGKWLVSGLVLNGWQHIQRPDGNNTPALGAQLTYKPNDRFTFNYSNFIGNDKPDEIKQWRFFHDFYAIAQLSEKFGLIAGLDIGSEEKPEGVSGWNTWYSPIVIVRYTATEKTNIAARVEYYSDENGVIVATQTPNGFKTQGYSANFDYAFSGNILWRIEGRFFKSKDKIFNLDGDPSSTNIAITTALGLSF
jgi:hypothetical protein